VASEAAQITASRRETTEATASGRAPLQSAGFVALVLLAPVVLVYLSFNAGGYFASSSGFATVILAQALVLRTTLAERPFEGFSRALAVPLVALTLYAAFQLVSVLWSHATARTLDSFDRTLLYLLALTLFGSLRFTRERIAWLLRALVAGIAVVCLIGLVSRVLPHAWPTASSFFSSRLSYPLTYWNAEGMLATLGLILGFHITATRGEHWAARVLAAAVLPGIAATLLLTFSRGALGVAALGLLAYCLLTRLHTLPAALLAVAPTTAIALRSAWDATLLASTQPTSAQAVAQGRHVAVVVAACMLAAGALRALLLAADRPLGELSLVRTPPRTAVRVGAGAAATAIVVALALALGAVGFATREYHKFVKANPAHTAQTRDRLGDPANNGRLELWQAALRIYRTQKLRGTGAGTYQPQYFRYRSEHQLVADAHSLYLQGLSELGVVGFALILLVVFGMLAGLAARIRGPDRALYAALFAATLAWAVHQAFDWDWQMPAVTLVVFVLAGAALARPRDGRVGLSGLPGGRTIVALGWLVLAIAPLLVSTSYARLQRAGEELKREECPRARSEAISSLSLSAKRPQAYEVVGICDLEQGFAQSAVPAMARATALERDDWEGWYWLAVARAGAGLDPRPAIARAIVLDPLENGLAHARLVLRSSDPRAWESAAPRLRREALTSGQFAITNL
jgi:hypothetical protein